MYTTQIKIVGNTIHQLLKENRKILAELKICTAYPHRTNFGRNMNLHIRLSKRKSLKRNEKEDSAYVESSTYFPINEINE